MVAVFVWDLEPIGRSARDVGHLRRVCSTGAVRPGGVTRRGTIRGGNSPRAARSRGDLCSRPRRDRVLSLGKSRRRSPRRYQRPKTVAGSVLAKTSVERLPSPGVRLHTDARAFTHRVSRKPSRLARALRRDTRETHNSHADQTMRPPAGRGFGGGGRGFGGRSPGGRGFGGRGGRGGRGSFDEGPPDTVVGTCSSPSRASRAYRSVGGSVQRRPFIPARRNCWFTLVPQRRCSREICPPPFPRSRLR